MCTLVSIVRKGRQKSFYLRYQTCGVLKKNKDIKLEKANYFLQMIEKYFIDIWLI